MSNYSATVRLSDDVKDDFFEFIGKSSLSFTKKGTTPKPTVVLRELIKAQLANIKDQGGTMLLGIEVKL